MATPIYDIQLDDMVQHDHPTSYVPYTGATADVDLGVNTLVAGNVNVMAGGTISLYGAGGTEIGGLGYDDTTHAFIFTNSAGTKYQFAGSALGIIDTVLLTGAPKTFTFPDKDGTFAMLDDLPDFSSQSYTTTFDATTSWGAAAGGYYTITFTHNLGALEVIVNVYDTTSGNYIVFPEVIEVADVNTVRIKVPETPDERFKGYVVIALGAGAGGTSFTAGAPTTPSYVTLATDANLANERVLTGTANQITITNNGANSTVVLSLPQSIATSSSPTFAGMTISAGTTGVDHIYFNTNVTGGNVGDSSGLKMLAVGTNDIGLIESIVEMSYLGHMDFYTASATNTLTKALSITSAQHLDMQDAHNIITGTTTGMKIGTATNQKLGFFNKAPVVQQAHIADATGAIDAYPKFNTLLSYLEALGFLATA